MVTLTKPTPGVTPGDDTNPGAGWATLINTALDALNSGKAETASPTFTGTPTAPTAAPGTSTTQVATTAFVQTATAAGVPDTGWRYLDGTNFPNHANSEGIIRRIGNRVQCTIRIGTVVNSVLVYAIPAGFQGATVVNVGGTSKLGSFAPRISQSCVVPNGTNSVPMTFAGTSITFHGQAVTGVQIYMAEWTTGDAWPTTVPGVPTTATP